MTERTDTEASMSVDSEAVDTTIDPAKHSKGVDADLNQTSDERAEAISEFDGHLDGSEGEQSLPTPDAVDVAEDPKSISRSE